MKPLRVAVGLSLAVLATLALGALHMPTPPDFFLLVVADMARGGAAVPAMLAGLPKATIIHGHGTGALRDAVRAMAAAHPLVRSARPGERGEGGDGATVVTF